VEVFAMNNAAKSPVELIPQPDQIRGRLMEVKHEASLLRQLLRVAERRERQRRIRGEAGPAEGATSAT
jgi:hypothetical protein